MLIFMLSIFALYKSYALYKVQEEYEEPYNNFNGITSKYGAHFILKIDKILIKDKYYDALDAQTELLEEIAQDMFDAEEKVLDILVDVREKEIKRLENINDSINLEARFLSHT